MTAAPAAAAVALGELPGARADAVSGRFDAHILGFALAAGASDAFPVAGVVAVPMVQAAMLRQLGKLFGVAWDKRAYTEFAAALGAATLVRTASSFGVRQLISSSPFTVTRALPRQPQRALPPPTPWARPRSISWGGAGRGGRLRKWHRLPPRAEPSLRHRQGA